MYQHPKISRAKHASTKATGATKLSWRIRAETRTEIGPMCVIDPFIGPNVPA